MGLRPNPKVKVHEGMGLRPIPKVEVRAFGPYLVKVEVLAVHRVYCGRLALLQPLLLLPLLLPPRRVRYSVHHIHLRLPRLQG